MTIYDTNFYYIKKLWKILYNKYVIPINYVLKKKICLNSKNIKTK